MVSLDTRIIHREIQELLIGYSHLKVVYSGYEAVDWKK